MIFNSIDEIQAVIEKPINEHALRRAREIKDKHQLHISGIGLDKYLSKIQGIENENALSIRRSLAKEATVPVYAKALKMFDKIFSARGGYRNYEFSNDSDKKAFFNLLENIDGEYSINDWMSTVWKQKVNIDPFGLAFFEIDSEQPEKVYLTYKCVNDIHDISYSSITDINYVVFTPFTRDKDSSLYYRVVDEKKDYLIKRQNNKFSIVEDETFDNYFGKVPACIFSNRNDKKSSCKDTWVSESMITADSYLLDHAIYTIYKTKQGIPYVYEYERACPVCQGAGVNEEGDTCPECNGSKIAKARNVSDVIILPVPADGVPTMTPPAGYVQPDLATWAQFETTLDREENEINGAISGGNAVTEQGDKNVTAYSIAVRNEPQEAKLNEVSRNAEVFEMGLVNILGSFYFPSTFKGATIVRGRRYKMNSHNELLATYNTLQKEDATTEILNEVIKEYWYSLYEYNEAMLKSNLIKLETKPFYHTKTADLINYQISKKDYLKHAYYDMFVVEYEKTKKLYMSTVEEVQTALEAYITTNYSALLNSNTDEQSQN